MKDHDANFHSRLIVAALAFSAAAQDWYHDRDERFRGEGWEPSVFMHVKTDLEHIWSAFGAADRSAVVWTGRNKS